MPLVDWERFLGTGHKSPEQSYSPRFMDSLVAAYKALSPILTGRGERRDIEAALQNAPNVYKQHMESIKQRDEADLARERNREEVNKIIHEGPDAIPKKTGLQQFLERGRDVGNYIRDNPGEFLGDTAKIGGLIGLTPHPAAKAFVPVSYALGKSGAYERAGEKLSKASGGLIKPSWLEHMVNVGAGMPGAAAEKELLSVVGSDLEKEGLKVAERDFPKLAAEEEILHPHAMSLLHGAGRGKVTAFGSHLAKQANESSLGDVAATNMLEATSGGETADEQTEASDPDTAAALLHAKHMFAPRMEQETRELPPKRSDLYDFLLNAPREAQLELPRSRQSWEDLVKNLESQGYDTQSKTAHQYRPFGGLF